MAAPLDPNVPANGDSPFFGAAEIRGIKQFLIDLWGIPPSPAQVTTPIGSTSTGGVFTPSSGFILPDVSPTVLGQLGRTGPWFQFHNGATVGSLPLVIDKSNTAVTVVNTLTQTTVYLKNLQAGLLGTDSRLRLTAIGRVNIKALHTVTIASAIAGVGNLVVLPLVGGTTTDRTNLALRLNLEFWMNGTLGSERALMEAHVTQAAVGLDAPAWGAPGGSNVGLDLGDIAFDMSPARNLQLYAQWSQADPADSVSFYQFLLELL